MIDFLMKNFLTITFVVLASISGFATTVYLIFKHPPREPSMLLTTKGSLIVMISGVLTIGTLYPVVYLLVWLMQDAYWGMTMLGLLTGWAICIVTSILFGYLGNKLALKIFKKYLSNQ